MARVIAAAIKAGYRHIDTAKVYGTEPLMGPVIAKLIESGEIKREDIFITCKVCGDFCHQDTRQQHQQYTCRIYYSCAVIFNIVMAGL